MKLTQNFTLAELTRSETAARAGLLNVPSPDGVEKLRLLAKNILEPVRAKFGRPVRVNSGYRSPSVNKLIGGSTTSQHMRCEAVDFEVPGVSNFDVAAWIAAGNLEAGFDQLILEAYTRGQPSSGWVHCSWRPEKRRAQVLTMTRKSGATVYLPGLVA